MFVSVAALQQLQELFLFSSAKMVPGRFCCLMCCWQEPPSWILLIMVLLAAVGPGGQSPSHHPGQEQALGGHWDSSSHGRQAPSPGWAEAEPGHGAHGRAGHGCGNGRPALLRQHVGRGWRPQGTAKRGAGPWARWGSPGRGWQGPEGCCGFWRWCCRCPAQEPRGRSPAGPGPQGERTCLRRADTSPECPPPVLNLNQV